MESKTKKAVSKRKILIVSATSIFVVVTIANSLVLGYLLLDRRIAMRDNYQVADLIVKSTQLRNKPAVIEPVSGKIYLPDAKLVLPASDLNVGDIAYAYVPPLSRDDINEEVNVVSVKDVQIAQSKLLSQYQEDTTTLFSGVPRLQACSRGIRITYEPVKDSGTVKATKKFSNGKTAYFYTEPLCDNPGLLEYVKQIDTY